jgi:hypothetical protein
MKRKTYAKPFLVKQITLVRILANTSEVVVV